MANQWIEDTYTKAHPLLGALRRHLVETIVDNNADRTHLALHPSEMAKVDWCPRKSWYQITGVENGGEEVGHRLANIFLEGHEVHGKYQQWFWDMGILEGVWACLRCNHRWWDLSPQSCPECGQEKWGIRYREVPIDVPDLGASGHADGLLALEDPALIEIKTVGLRTVEMERPSLYEEYTEHRDLMTLWKSISTPFPSHVRQGAIYCRGAEIEKMIYIYEFKPTQDVKMFTVNYREEVLRHVIPGAMAVQRALDNVHYEVARPKWADDPTQKTCKQCPYVAHCWQGEE